jgi:thiol-disulfide isomerase/thioredoxin
MNNMTSSIIANQHECFLISVYRKTVKINVFDMKRLFSYVIFFLLATLPVASAYSQSTLKEDRFILFIGHNQISHQYYDNMIKEERDKILKGLEKKEDNISMRGAVEPRVAILGYGEKARNGIFFLNAKKDTTMCEVQGKISTDYNGETMMLFTFDKKGSVASVDSTIIRHGCFYFFKKSETETYSVLSVGNYPYPVCSTQLVLEKGTVKVTMNDSIKTVIGTAMNDAFNKIDSTIKAANNMIYGYKQKDGRDWWSKDSVTIDKNLGISFQTIKAYFIPNRDNCVGERIYDILLHKSFIFQDSIYKYRSAHLDSLSITKKYLYSKKRENQIYNTLIGKPYYDMAFEDEMGKQVRLSSLIGKSVVLLDVWASWCSPCKAAIPELKKLYNDYKDKGVLFVSVSIDRGRIEWKNELAEQRMPWLQLRDIDLKNTVLMKKYMLTGVPHYIIINKKGKIIISSLAVTIKDLKKIIDLQIKS